MLRALFETFFILVVCFDLLTMYYLFLRRRMDTFLLGLIQFSSAVLTSGYLISTKTSDYFTMSLSSAVYFSGISVTLLLLFFYIFRFCRFSTRFIDRIILLVLSLCTMVDVIVEMLNPFLEIAISYERVEGKRTCFDYAPMPLYQCHLGLCYVLLLCVFWVLIRCAANKPTAYRGKYLAIIWGVLILVIMNMHYLVVNAGSTLDYSVLFYSLVVYYLYWLSDIYSRNGMLNRVRELVLEELDNPILLFDEDDVLVTENRAAQFLIEMIPESSALGAIGLQQNTQEQMDDSSIPLIHEMDEEKNETIFEKYFLFERPKRRFFADFVRAVGFDEQERNWSQDQHFQWIYRTDNKRITYRVDYHVLRDGKGRLIGRMFNLTDSSLEMDLLTGFYSSSSYRHHVSEFEKNAIFPTAVAVCDLNRLSIINHTMGVEMGDKAVYRLAHLMRKYFPKTSYLVRLEDANLMAVCPGMDGDEIREIIKKVRESLRATEGYCLKLDMQSAVCVVTEENPSIDEAAQNAIISMKHRKLMDGGSSHSSLLNSLSQTLLESDDETDAHVKRTKRLGERLGRRMGFSDIQLSNLSLLCMLHDIGKLGIPMEILNKPGKLNAAEWEVMRSHTEKGYRIAMASEELEGIAGLILHHHECWNGSGYPDGLAQESIPLLSRVIGVVDTYDAMVNDRPYRKAMTQEEAIAELRRCAGTQFDPVIVSELTTMLEEDALVERATKMERQWEIEDENAAAAKAAMEMGDIRRNLARTEVVAKGERRGIQKQEGAILNPGGSDLLEAAEQVRNTRPVLCSRFCIDEEDHIYAIDAVFTEITGYTGEDLQQHPLTMEELIPLSDRAQFRQVRGQQQAAYWEKHQHVYYEHRILRKDSTFRFVFTSEFMMQNEQTGKREAVAYMTDMASTNAVAQIRRQSRDSVRRNMDSWSDNIRKDSLTGILNHEAFISDVEIQLMKANQSVVLYIMDVDYFKQYNDSFGHLAGDKMLTLVAKTLQDNVSTEGFAGRLGGDEFAAAIILHGDEGIEAAARRGQLLWKAVMNAVSTQEQAASITMGGAIKGLHGSTFNQLYQSADKALYEAKEAGRKTFRMKGFEGTKKV